MGLVKWLTLVLQHPLDIKTFVQFYFQYYRKRLNHDWKNHPSSGLDRQTRRRCWELFDITDKEASMIIKELDGDLAGTLLILFLVLRALDTIEDDMTLPDAIKQPILRSFHIHAVTPGWKFDGCGPNEKHRQLLVEFDNVVEEVNLMSPQYRNILIDTVLRTGTGMADYAHKSATTGSLSIETVAEYDLYCHYAAGIPTQALSQIFAASGQESTLVGDRLDLSNSAGLFFQKSDFISDYREDLDQKRYFWPREIWGRDEYGFKEMTEMQNTDPDTVRRATYVQSGMILDALRHAIDSLNYLRLLRNRSILNNISFLAVMAIANLELCFMNKEMFQRKIEIRKPEAAKLIIRATNMREVVLIFLEYTRKIHAKAVRSDPNFTPICMACDKIEQYCEQYCDQDCSEESSTANTSISELTLFTGAAFLFLLVVGVPITVLK